MKNMDIDTYIAERHPLTNVVGLLLRGTWVRAYVAKELLHRQTRRKLLVGRSKTSARGPLLLGPRKR